MLHSIVHLDFTDDLILSDITREFETPMVVTRQSIHADDTITFVAEVSQARDKIASRLGDSKHVRNVGKIGDNMLLIRKRSCGAMPIIREKDGYLFGLAYAYGTERAFEILTFDHEAVRGVVEALEEIGVVELERIASAPDRPGGLSARQYEIVTAAIEAGYYEWPRQMDAEDIANEFDITHPTFLEHLRKAERKLLLAALPSQRTDHFDDISTRSVISRPTNPYLDHKDSPSGH
jgi:predicted DNA binding protein